MWPSQIMWLYSYTTCPFLLIIAQLSHPAFKADQTETRLEGESGGYMEEIHKSNLLLDILLTAGGHSVTRLLKFRLKGGIQGSLQTGLGDKSWKASPTCPIAYQACTDILHNPSICRCYSSLTASLSASKLCVKVLFANLHTCRCKPFFFFFFFICANGQNLPYIDRVVSFMRVKNLAPQRLEILQGLD